jgi:hypothetical protein
MSKYNESAAESAMEIAQKAYELLKNNELTEENMQLHQGVSKMFETAGRMGVQRRIIDANTPDTQPKETSLTEATKARKKTKEHTRVGVDGVVRVQRFAWKGIISDARIRNFYKNGVKDEFILFTLKETNPNAPIQDLQKGLDSRARAEGRGNRWYRTEGALLEGGAKLVKVV